ncbi:MAG: 5-(carboxyamino)imidazole ribonucleotide synthase [Rubrivivax sp.]|nr:5-(carboxyamino)imidazole ribonucleotide synthase [Rubrivivax sp.]
MQKTANRTVGVLGGGQLGRMFVHAAQAHGYRVVVLEPDAASPAGAAADEHLVAAYDDPVALETLACHCHAITTEFENVPATSLRQLAANITVSPPAGAVEICQHRSREKALFIAAGVPCAPHVLLTNAADFTDPGPAAPTALTGAGLTGAGLTSAGLTSAGLTSTAFANTALTTASLASTAPARSATLLPGLLKTASLGYDGKGQRSVATQADLVAAFAALGGVPCVLEKRLPLHRELSVIVARGVDGQVVHLPVQQNLHRDGILAVTEVPAPDVDVATAALAVQWAEQLAAALQYVGVLCVEFFLLADGSLVANEMAPRPHNSGHHSIDACDVSQFDLQLRTLLGLPLVQPRLHSPAVMLNLLGDLWFDGRRTGGPEAVTPTTAHLLDTRGTPVEPHTPDWPGVLALPGVHLHLYGKAEPRRGRKMGHLTVTAASAAAARAVALQAAAHLGLPAF